MCMDFRQWASKDGRTCGDYVAQKWCNTAGEKGEGWWHDSDIDDWKGESGHSALDACCACGGGQGVRATLGAAGTQGCPEGAMHLDETLCKQAAEAVGAKFELAASWPIGHPGGCHADAGGKSGWLNLESTGTKREDFAPICATVVEASRRKAADEDEDDEDEDDEDEDDEEPKKSEEKSTAMKLSDLPGPVGGVCMNFPRHWRSKTNHTCQQYEDLGWCTINGTEGPGWKANGNFSEWAVDGITGLEACCACGGGRQMKVVLGTYGSEACVAGDVIRVETECKQAAKSLGAKFAASAKWPLGNPGGCHIDEAKKTVWLNTAESGTPRTEFAPVCAVSPEQKKALAVQKVVTEKEDEDDKEEDEEEDEEKDAPPPKKQINAAELAKLRKEVVVAHNALSENMAQRAMLGRDVARLEEETVSNASGSVAKAVLNETQSAAMADMLANMMQEMRAIGNPFYTERLESKLDHLEKKTPKLQAAYDDAKRALEELEGEEAA